MSPPAARLTDFHACPMVTPGVPPIPHVGGPILPSCAAKTLIEGLAAARVGDLAFCVGPPDVIVMGSAGCLIEGKKAARVGDMTAHGGVIVAGAAKTLIGDAGGGGGRGDGASGGGGAAGRAATGTAFGKAPSRCRTKSPALAEAKEKRGDDWIEIELVDETGRPVPHEKYSVRDAEGTLHVGFVDEKGLARVDGIPPGECQVSFPNLDKDAWSKKA